MKRASVLALAGALALAACSDASTDAFAPSGPELAAGGNAGTIRVTSTADAGAGTLRAALEAANVDPGVGRIHLDRGLAVALASPLVYTGAQRLTIQGRGAVLDATGLPDASATPALNGALVANGGGDLSITDLTVRGSTGVGILVDVPGDRTGTFALELRDVVVENSRLHGLLLNDQADYFADFETRAAGGSDAGLQVRVKRSRFVGNGFGGLDNDGFRINEGGAGSLDAVIAHSRFEANGADGIELDERAEGDVVFTLEHTTIIRNGAFSSADFDDGIDVDEMGGGDIVGRFVQVTANSNYEQGIDLNENNEGDLRVTMHQVTAEENAEEGIEFEEDDDFEDFPSESWGGSVDVTLTGVTTNRNGAEDGDAGLKVREKFAGDLTARVVNATALDNAVSGIELREGQGGNMDAEVVSASLHRNDGAGLRLRGNGIVRVQALDATGNANGPIVSDAGIVVE